MGLELSETTRHEPPKILLGIAVFLIIVSIVFFANGVSLSSTGEVAAGLLSALIGFALLASSITLFRLWSALRLREEKE